MGDNNNPEFPGNQFRFNNTDLGSNNDWITDGQDDTVLTEMQKDNQDFIEAFKEKPYANAFDIVNLSNGDEMLVFQRNAFPYVKGDSVDTRFSLLAEEARYSPLGSRHIFEADDTIYFLFKDGLVIVGEKMNEKPIPNKKDKSFLVKYFEANILPLVQDLPEDIGQEGLIPLAMGGDSYNISLLRKGFLSQEIQPHLKLIGSRISEASEMMESQPTSTYEVINKLEKGFN